MDVAINGSYAYVTDSQNGLLVIDITDKVQPGAPSTVGTGGAPTAVTIATVTVSGTPTPYAFVAAGKGGLVVLNAATASAPVLVGTPVIITDATNAIASANDVVVSGNYAYVAAGSAGLVIFDVSTPSSPVKQGAFATRDAAQGVAVSGSVAYVAAGSGGVQIVDVSDPTNPRQLGVSSTPDYAWHVAVSSSGADTYAYVADGSAGLQVMKVTDSSNPSSVAAVDTPSWRGASAYRGRRYTSRTMWAVCR